MEDNVVENEAEAIEVPVVNKFACLGIAECQQVLERLKGGNIMDSLPHAVQTLMDEFKHDKDTLKREVSERREELERHRKTAVDLQISAKYAPALEAYDAYFEVLGSQIGDYEAEQLRKECRQHVEQAKKKKIQLISAVVIVLVLCGVIVDQVIFRQHVKSFQSALHSKDLEEATGAAVKISWRYDSDTGIANLISFLEEKDNFNRMFSDELIKSGLDNYGGIEWQEVLDLIAQADGNEDLPQAIQQVRQATQTTPGLIVRCEVLEKNKRDFDDMYGSCNQKDAAFYAQEKWEDLQELYETEVTQTNLNVITERYDVMVEITNRVGKLMHDQKEMQPVKDDFETRLEEEKIEVMGMLNYRSSELDEALQKRAIALTREAELRFSDARLIYHGAIEHIKESKKNRLVDVEKLTNIEESRREFIDLFKKHQEDIDQAQERYTVEWKALSDQKQKAELEYAKKERWSGSADADYNAALIRLKYLIEIVGGGDAMYISKARCDLLYDQVDAGVAKKWFADDWNAVRGQKKKADDTYKNGEHNKDDVRVYYDEASQLLKSLLVKISDNAKKRYFELGRIINEIPGNLDKLERGLPEEWKNLQALVEKAEMAYSKTSYWESGEYKSYLSATLNLLKIYEIGKQRNIIIPVIIEHKIDTFKELMP